MTADDAASAVPLPDRGWSRRVTAVPRALVVPPQISRLIQPCGVFGPAGWVPEAATWRGRRPTMIPPETRPDPVRQLPGRHLWMGHLWVHFGHFLAESLARVWGAAQSGPLDGLVFIPKRPGAEAALRGYQREMLQLLGLDLPVTVADAPTEVEELIVPGQGFGLGAIDRGTPELHAFFHDRFARDVAPAGGPRLYLSRSALGGLEGGALLEQRLEQNLAAQGYEIFHPQQHSIRDQVARYRAATHVVGLDGSAFHLFGFVARPEQKAAVILRRNSSIPDGIAHQLEGFTGTSPTVVNAVLADWVPEARDRPGRWSFGQLDFGKVGADLAAAGFIDAAAPWPVPTFRAAKQAVLALGREKKLTFVRRQRPERAQAAE